MLKLCWKRWSYKSSKRHMYFWSCFMMKNNLTQKSYCSGLWAYFLAKIPTYIGRTCCYCCHCLNVSVIFLKCSDYSNFKVSNIIDFWICCILKVTMSQKTIRLKSSAVTYLIWMEIIYAKNTNDISITL